MLHEREKRIGAAPYERSEERNGHANGYKERTLSSRLGQLNLSVPHHKYVIVKVRGGDGPFHPRKRACLAQSLDAALLSEKALKVALKVALAEMYVQGVSTRRVSAVLESLCGTQVSSMTVSRAVQELDAVLGEWRERPLGVFPFVQLDALWCKVRQNGLVKDAAVLVASGVGEDGKRALLGVSVSAQSFVPNDRAGEHEVHWRLFLEGLVARGLRGVQLITSDDHSGLACARRAVFGGVLWQRCQFHLQQNAQAYVPKDAMKAEVAATLRAIFTAPDLSAAQALLKTAVVRYQTSGAAKLATWLEQAVPEGLTVFAFPEAYRRFLRTSNGLERKRACTRG